MAFPTAASAPLHPSELLPQADTSFWVPGLQEHRSGAPRKALPRSSGERKGREIVTSYLTPAMVSKDIAPAGLCNFHPVVTWRRCLARCLGPSLGSLQGFLATIILGPLGSLVFAGVEYQRLEDWPSSLSPTRWGSREVLSSSAKFKGGGTPKNKTNSLLLR